MREGLAVLYATTMPVALRTRQRAREALAAVTHTVAAAALP